MSYNFKGGKGKGKGGKEYVQKYRYIYTFFSKKGRMLQGRREGRKGKKKDMIMNINRYKKIGVYKKK